jgi:hypothetical protein
MSRIVLVLSVSVLALSSLVIAVSIARPGANPIAHPANAAGPDFDAVFADAASGHVGAFSEADRERLREIGLARISASAAR